MQICERAAEGHGDGAEGAIETGGGCGPRSLGQTRVAVAIVRFVGHSCVGKNGQIRLGGMLSVRAKHVAFGMLKQPYLGPEITVFAAMGRNNIKT